ncbi:hypothetical protein JCM33374_g75 [Metschnikowia sp. JCM 33374]|nr:hypothetical protein JCM33374_g75 [Metschnikowia sp. JCM 33374]
MEWREKYNQSTFVIYLGSTPVLIVNDRNDIEYLWSHHSTALNSRPTSHTFHNVISATQGPTIGTTPAGSSFRKKRKVLSMHLSVKSLTTQINVEALDQCSQYIIRNILIETTKLNPMRYPFSDISLLRHFQCYVLSCAIKLTYGISLDTHVKDRQLANKIIETENHIINFRSFISNYQDYLPIFRIFPFNMVVNNDANFWKTERDKYIDQLQAEFENQLHGNIYPSCKSILAQITSERAGARTLNQQETRSLCLTMISAGLDNLGFTMNYIVGQLAGSENGYKMQERLFWELMSASDDDIVQAWKNSACHMNCDYALAIIQEALRKFSVLPLGLPRLTTKSVQFGDIAIPKDTVLFMNVFAANHDPSMCQMPDAFQPQRWLDSNGKLIKSSEMIQFTFGLGSRKCAGDRLSIKEIPSNVVSGLEPVRVKA